MTSPASSPIERDLLQRLEVYYDSVPRPAADTEACGPFTLFVSRGPWPYYARPRLGLDQDATADDVRTLRALMVKRGVPEQIEWLPSVAPSIGTAAAAAGLDVHTFPLLALQAPVAAAPPEGVAVRLLREDDPTLGDVLAAVHRGFGADESGLDATETTETTETDNGPDASTQADLVRHRIAAGLQTVVAAYDADGRAVGGGSHQPVEGVTELVGIAVVPEARRRGIGAALTTALVNDAYQQGVETLFLSAEDDTVARTYERVGFRRIGQVCAAEPPSSP